MTSSRPVVHVFSWVGGLAATLRSKCPSLEVNEIKIPPRFQSSKNDLTKESLEQLRNAEILITCPQSVQSFDVLYELKKAKWVMSAWAGVDGIIKCVDPVKGPPNFTLTRFGGVFGPHISEFVIGSVIRYERMFDGIRKSQEESRWATLEFCNYHLLSSLTLGIVGYGDIGCDVAKAAKCFGMKVFGMSRRESIPEDRMAPVDKYMPISRLSEMLAECDYVCNLLPSTKDTRGLFSGDTLKPCQAKKSVFINVGRGDVVDDVSIIRALDEGWLRHAILDVHNPEPLPSTSPLWGHPLITLTPHVSGNSSADQVADLFLENFERYVNGEPLTFLVDWKAGY